MEFAACRIQTAIYNFMPLRARNIDWRSALAHENCRVFLAFFPVDYIFRLDDFGVPSPGEKLCTKQRKAKNAPIFHVYG